MSTPQRFVFVDALRGLAALWIVVFHAFSAKHMAHLEPWLPSWLLRVIFRGDLAVAVFFALSGFVIAHAIGNARVDAAYALRFILRRRLRLDPPYVASIALVIGVGYLLAFGPELMPRPTPLLLAAHLFYLQDLLQLAPFSPVYWTLCLEIQFYVVFCLLLAVADRFRAGGEDWRSRRLVFAAAGLFALARLAFFRWPLWPGLFVPTWHTFLVGAFAAWAFAGRISRGSFYLFVALLAAASLPTQNRFAEMAAVTAVLLLEVGRAGRLGDWLGWRPLGFLGAISYSLYLVHSPVTAVASAYTLYRLTPRTAGWEALWLAVFVVLSCAGAFVVHRLIERPSIWLSHRLAGAARSHAAPRDHTR